MKGSRRKFLQAFTATGATLLLGSIGTYFPAGVQLSPASEPKRKWVKVIDLERCDGCAES